MKLNERHILFVDDDESDLLWLKTLAQSIDDNHRYIIYPTHDAAEAIEVYAENPIECAIIDYNMPKQNGVQLVRSLHALPSHVSLRRPLPVVVISGTQDELMMNHIRQIDAMRFVLKSDIRSATDLQLIIDHMLKASEDDKRLISAIS